MKRLVVFAVSVLAVGVVACSSDDPNGLKSGLSTSATMTADSSPVLLHVYRNPADTIPKSDTVHYKKLPYYLPADEDDRSPVITDNNGVVVPNGDNNVVATFSKPRIADIADDGAIEGDSLGTTVMTYTFTDFNQNHATQATTIPITVVIGSPPPPERRANLSRVGTRRSAHRVGSTN